MPPILPDVALIQNYTQSGPSVRCPKLKYVYLHHHPTKNDDDTTNFVVCSIISSLEPGKLFGKFRRAIFFSSDKSQFILLLPTTYDYSCFTLNRRLALGCMASLNFAALFPHLLHAEKKQQQQQQLAEILAS